MCCACPDTKILRDECIVEHGPDACKKKKMCCACPDTKILRDECIVEHGPDACKKWIDAHLRCLHAEGFNVSIVYKSWVVLWL
ncbi:hypothetical protein O6H91_13G033100 [Diphasiastrum complanatum]|uniref:Uncharacterized protein n=1 Tax=Diphasiastrum complanatum TaxID=34168 RepID=A0ACC2BTY3_DIPCM|nr:hypothetical protein O6H91_13G033100 [Diphasiastrum complanatum]